VNYNNTVSIGIKTASGAACTLGSCLKGLINEYSNIGQQFYIGQNGHLISAMMEQNGR
jgi:hypothetical protein